MKDFIQGFLFTIFIIAACSLAFVLIDIIDDVYGFNTGVSVTIVILGIIGGLLNLIGKGNDNKRA